MWDDEFTEIDVDVLEIVDRLEEVLDGEYEDEYQPLDFENED